MLRNWTPSGDRGIRTACLSDYQGLEELISIVNSRVAIRGWESNGNIKCRVEGAPDVAGKGAPSVEAQRSAPRD